MNQTQKISIRLETEIIEQIKNILFEQDMSDFIRTAIKNELKMQAKEVKDEAQINKVLEQLDTKNIENKVNDTSIKMQLIFNEIKKQSEILKLVHRRSSHSANYALKIISEVSKSPEAVEACFNETNQVIAGEIKELGI